MDINPPTAADLAQSGVTSLEGRVRSLEKNVADHEQQIGYLKSQINYIISLFPEGTALGRGYEESKEG